ncbi:hypothetical protein AB9P05_24530 [Roseivirga sp. BDSF3-8]|uniref:hypothetical protein n=1 Tax=Roseivirga sp. BDSF3-8 TaxID=3241598 RepID=UPI00353206B0
MKKLRLKDLSLERFVTHNSRRPGSTIRGGGNSGVDYDYSLNCNGSEYCYVPTDDCESLGCSNYCTDKTNCC